MGDLSGSVARFAVAAFRADAARAEAVAVRALVDELCVASPEFASMGRDNDVCTCGDGAKNLHHRCRRDWDGILAIFRITTLP